MTLKLRREHYVRLYLEVNSVLKIQDAGTNTSQTHCRSVLNTVSDKRLRHDGSGYETTEWHARVSVQMYGSRAPFPIPHREKLTLIQDPNVISNHSRHNKPHQNAQC